MEMSDNEKDTVNDVLNILKVELSNDSEHQEQLAILVTNGKAKKMIGVSLTQDQVKKLTQQDVEKYFKRYEASLSSKTCDAMIDTFLSHVKHQLIFSLLMKENF